jgi:ribulose-5-phosphate 4-epimerase/fuculose-1-phosphate aldolase
LGNLASEKLVSKFSLSKCNVHSYEKVGEAAILGYNHGMAVWAQDWLAAVWRTVGLYKLHPVETHIA